MSQDYITIRIPTFSGNRMILINGLLIGFSATYLVLVAFSHAFYIIPVSAALAVKGVALLNFIAQLTFTTEKKIDKTKEKKPEQEHWRFSQHTFGDLTAANSFDTNIPHAHKSKSSN